MCLRTARRQVPEWQERAVRQAGRGCREALHGGGLQVGPTFEGVYRFVALAQVVGQHSMVGRPHSNLIHGLWVVLGTAHIGLNVNLSHSICLVCGPDLHEPTNPIRFIDTVWPLHECTTRHTDCKQLTANTDEDVGHCNTRAFL